LSDGEGRAGSMEVPIEGVLDLHTFRPGDVKDLVPRYLSECRKRGILEVRIIHGKGTGALRATVGAILDRLPYVVSHGTDAHGHGGWGATVATLAPPEDADGSAAGRER
jgi:dsDNA-specific endonuclease/ATPase MutS2